MRPACLMTVIVCGLCLAGCGGPAGSGQNTTDKPGNSLPPTSVAAPGGIVRGQVLRPPGPDPRSGAPGSTVPVSGDPVHAKDSSGKTIASDVTGPDGHFELTVPLGTYQIAEDTCGVSQQVEVRSGAPASVSLSIRNAC